MGFQDTEDGLVVIFFFVTLKFRDGDLWVTMG